MGRYFLKDQYYSKQRSCFFVSVKFPVFDFSCFSRQEKEKHQGKSSSIIMALQGGTGLLCFIFLPVDFQMTAVRCDEKEQLWSRKLGPKRTQNRFKVGVTYRLQWFFFQPYRRTSTKSMNTVGVLVLQHHA